MPLPSNLPIRVPKRVSPGDDIKASDFNMLRDAIVGMIQRGQREFTQAVPDFKPPFWVSYSWDAENEEWKYKVRPGYVTYQNIQVDSGDGPTHYFVPTLGGTSLEATTPPEGTLPANACFIYVKVLTTAKGAISATPTIEAESSAQSSTHHIPPSPGDAGTTGVYWFLIAQFQDDGGTPGKPEIVRRITGNRNIPNQLVEIQNIGGEREWVESYTGGATDKWQIRTAEAVGTGKPTLKPVGGGGEGSTLKWRALSIASPLGDGTGGTGGGPFSYTAADTDDQITLTSSGVTGTTNLSDGASITFAGGVCTSITGASTPSGWWGTVSWTYADVGGGFSQIKIDVEDGIIVDIYGSNTSPGSGYTTSGLGTEASPEITDLAFSDTDT